MANPKWLNVLHPQSDRFEDNQMIEGWFISYSSLTFFFVSVFIFAPLSMQSFISLGFFFLFLLHLFHWLCFFFFYVVVYAISQYVLSTNVKEKRKIAHFVQRIVINFLPVEEFGVRKQQLRCCHLLLVLLRCQNVYAENNYVQEAREHLLKDAHIECFVHWIDSEWCWLLVWRLWNRNKNNK